MKIEIKKVNGKWEVNGKSYSTLSGSEKLFFEEFLSEMRLNYHFEKSKAELVVDENYIGTLPITGEIKNGYYIVESKINNNDE
jgi:hypothetical protein